MDSSDDDSQLNNGPPKAKKRRLPRACDACRKKKIKCDSSEMPNNICSSCAQQSIQCMHDTPYKKRTNKEYVDFLEQRCKAMEQLLRDLQQHHPRRNFMDEINSRSGPSVLGIPSPKTPEVRRASSMKETAMRPADPLLYFVDKDEASDGEEEEEQTDITERFANMNIHSTDHRFFGKGSNFALLNKAYDLKEKVEGTPSEALKVRRDKYWITPSWEAKLRLADTYPTLSFPEPDLLEHLIQTYLDSINIFFPFIHGPTMKRLVLSESLHIRDYSLGRLVLMICAVASKFTDDERVLLDGKGGETLTAGIKWFEQVNLLQTRYLFDVLPLFDIQTICVGVLFLFGTTIPQGTWTLSSLALRSCHERGIHKRLPSGGKSTKTVEDELFKRAFWYMVLLDSAMTTFSGRPSAITWEDIEIDYPTECDDEYWRITPSTSPHSSLLSFRQPPNKPSLTIGFNLALRLYELYAVSNRTLYASSRSRALFGVGGDDWEGKVVTELDSCLNNWLDKVPAHLRWGGGFGDEPIHFFNQSCFLYTVYYGLQIQIHRPFLYKKGSPLAFPSLAICTNSARACSHILAAQMKKGTMRIPQSMMTANISSFILLMNIYGAKKTNITLDPTRELKAIHTFLKYLNICAKHWNIAGRFADLIAELAADAMMTFEDPSPIDIGITSTTLKRGRGNLDGSGREDTVKMGYGSLRQESSLASPSKKEHTMTPLGYPVTTDRRSSASGSGSSSAPSPPDWNINPYAFPAVPTASPTAASTTHQPTEGMMYPPFYVEPSMTPSAWGLQELERLSRSIVDNVGDVDVDVAVDVGGLDSNGIFDFGGWVGDCSGSGSGGGTSGVRGGEADGAGGMFFGQHQWNPFVGRSDTHPSTTFQDQNESHSTEPGM